MKLAILDLNGEGAAAVAAEIASAGGEAMGCAVDVTSAQALERVASDVVDAFGGVHVLCANAGVMLPIGPLAEKTAEDWEYVFSVNVHGVVKTVAAFLPHLAAADEAHIVTTASLGGIVSVPQIPLGVYIASKYACVGYSECLREELSTQGIGVSVLCPGLVASDLYHTSAKQRPGRFGGPQTVSAPAMGGTPDAMPAEEVGPIVVRGIRQNRLHIFTHPKAEVLAERRFESIRADFQAEARAQGAGSPKL